MCSVGRGGKPIRTDVGTPPSRDGCQRSDFGIGFDTSPEWVYVYRNPAIRMAQGTVRVAHGSLQDSILEHRSFDFNGNLVPDPPFRYLIAGSPIAKDGQLRAWWRRGPGTAAFRVGERDDAAVRMAHGR